jgi:hypothetical protein
MTPITYMTYNNSPSAAAQSKISNIYELLVDFRNIEQDDKIGAIINENPKYDDNSHYDDTTCLYYKAHRIKKTDPITYEELNDNNAFKYPYIWNPYTGSIIKVDPFGPLYFNPMTLLQHFYQNKLNGLWIEQSDTYEGYYGAHVGAGPDFEIIGRGIYPEKYLFRLPINCCYLKQNHKYNLITMGPILTDDEIKSIDKIIKKYWSYDESYYKIYKKIGSLYTLKYYYDIAIAKEPIYMNLNPISINKKQILLKYENPNYHINRLAVDIIRQMH